MYLLNNLMEASVYLSIAAIFLFAWLRCLVPINRIKRQLRRATRELKRDGEKNAWQDKNFLGKGALHPHWNEFLNNRLFADEDYHNACAVEDYINETTAIESPGASQFSDAVPGICVSLGFLGTLLGIMLGLADFSMDSSEAVMNSVRVLIGGMRYAFTTSIVGVVASILYSLVSRAARNSASRALEKFYDSMIRNAGVVTVDPINQIAIYQQEQTALLQSIAEDLTGGMTDRLGSVLEMALEPVRSSLNDFITATTREQIKGIDLIVSRFISRMNDVMEGQFENLSKTISETCRWQEETREAVGLTMDGVGRVSRDILQIEQLSESLIVKFDGYMTKLGSAQLQIDDGYAAVSANVKNMELVARQQANYVAQIGQMQADLRKDIVSFQTSMDSFMKAMVENTNISTGALRKTSEELRHNGDVLNDAHKVFIAGVNKELKHTFDMFDANMSDITNQLSWVIGNIKDTIDGLPAVIEASAVEYADQLNRLIGTMRGAQQALEDGVRRLDVGGNE